MLPKIGRKYTNKRENEEEENNQDKKKPKKVRNNLENTIQKWVEQQEIRQRELDKMREENEKKNQEKRSQILQMKQQSDKVLFGLLNNLTNCLMSSLHEKANNQGKFKFDKLNSSCRSHDYHMIFTFTYLLHYYLHYFYI